MAELSAEETRRYARHLVLKGIGGVGQGRLKAARVLVVGAGGLGSPVVADLAAAGIGTIGIVDDDTIALSNLQRQIVHTTAAAGLPKTQGAEAFVRALNPNVAVEPHTERLSADNAGALLTGADVVVDGTDSFATRQILADAAEAAGVPLVAGDVSMFDGQLTVLAPHLGGPRLAALYPTAPDDADLPTCEVTGVLGAVTGVIGTLMAMEVIKLVTRTGDPLIGRLLLYDGRGAKFTEVGYG